MIIYYTISSIILVWLVIVTWVLFKTRKHYYNLIGKSKKHTIEELLEHLLANDEKKAFEIEKLLGDVKLIVEQSKIPIQKIGIKRFNPFDRSGGEQSFVIALLNYHNTGLIINFIYTKEGLRTYIKKIKEGKALEYGLSEEEQEAVSKSSHF